VPADTPSNIELIYSEAYDQPQPAEPPQDNIELIYNDDPAEIPSHAPLGPVYGEPSYEETNRNSMADNPYYGRDSSLAQDQSFAYNLETNSSYGKTDKVEAVENIYEEPSP